MDSKMTEVLKRIADILNREGISYGVGASVMLCYYGITEEAGDIDIQVDIGDIHRLDRLLSALGEREKVVPDETYRTRYFYEYIIDGVEIDVMGGLCVVREGREFSFDFTAESVGDYMKLGDIEVPLGRLDEWHRIYQVLPGRGDKVKMIENYMKERKV